jgi:dTDP-4-dehydrorhamnose reductase
VKALVLGAGGQLGRALLARSPATMQVSGATRAEADLLDTASIVRCLERERPQVVINAAAYTLVERAESQPDAAFAVNGTGVATLARAVAAAGARLVHVSTDYVFDGSAGVPADESAPTAPLNVYGRSKLEGERHVREILGEGGLTLRTAWLYSARGKSFLGTMLRRMRADELVRVVCDQVGTPTSATSLAEAVWRVCERPRLHGLLHWTDAGVASWYDFAVAIQEDAAACGLLPAGVRTLPIHTSEYPTEARRPPYSVLDCRAARAALDLEPAHWRVRLRETLQELACAHS